MTPDVGLVAKLGGYSEKRQKLQEERRQEYNRMLAEVKNNSFRIVLKVKQIKIKNSTCKTGVLDVKRMCTHSPWASPEILMHSSVILCSECY